MNVICLAKVIFQDMDRPTLPLQQQNVCFWTEGWLHILDLSTTCTQPSEGHGRAELISVPWKCIQRSEEVLHYRIWLVSIDLLILRKKDTIILSL